MQILTPKQARDFPRDIFDITKVWPHGEVPPMKVGKLVLNRNAVNYFAEVEQAAFCPGNVVPGIAISPDKMLQARVFSYHDYARPLCSTRPIRITVEGWQRGCGWT